MILESPCLIPDFKGKGAAYFLLFNVPGGKNKQGIILAPRRLNGKALAMSIIVTVYFSLPGWPR